MTPSLCHILCHLPCHSAVFLFPLHVKNKNSTGCGLKGNQYKVYISQCFITQKFYLSSCLNSSSNNENICKQNLDKKMIEMMKKCKCFKINIYFRHSAKQVHRARLIRFLKNFGSFWKYIYLFRRMANLNWWRGRL